MARLRDKKTRVPVPRWRWRYAKSSGKKSAKPPFKPNFHWFVDITTLLASLATVVALAFLIHDRRDQANIAAWTLLQSYLQQEHRAHFNEGQNFAVETLVRNRVSLDGLDAHGIWLSSIDAVNASFAGGNFEDAILEGCRCNGAVFFFADLRGARISGEFEGATFDTADISDADFKSSLIAPDSETSEAVQHACYRPHHPPKSLQKLPLNPQSPFCLDAWGDEWATLDKSH